MSYFTDESGFIEKYERIFEQLMLLTPACLDYKIMKIGGSSCKTLTRKISEGEMWIHTPRGYYRITRTTIKGQNTNQLIVISHPSNTIIFSGVSVQIADEIVAYFEDVLLLCQCITMLTDT